MARRGTNIRNAFRHALLTCCAADTFAKGECECRRLALKRTKHQFIAHQPIEARPVEIGQKLPDQSGDVCHIGDGVPFARRDRFRRGGEIGVKLGLGTRSEEHTSELQSLMRISYAVFCLKKKNMKK